MTHLNAAGIRWRKSTRCDAGNCVEVAFGDDIVAMRDNKDVDGPVLTFTAQAWTTFLDGVRAGDLESR